MMNKKTIFKVVIGTLMVLLSAVTISFIIVASTTTDGEESCELDENPAKPEQRFSQGKNIGERICEDVFKVQNIEKLHQFPHRDKAEKLFPRLDETEKDREKAVLKLIDAIIAYYDSAFASNPQGTRQKWIRQKTNKLFELGRNSVDIGGVKIVRIVIVEGVTGIEVALKNGWHGLFSLCTQKEAVQTTHYGDQGGWFLLTSKSYGYGFWISDLLTKDDIASYLLGSKQSKGLSVAMCTDFISKLNDSFFGVRFKLANEVDVAFASSDTSVPYELVSNREYGMGAGNMRIQHPRHVIIDWHPACADPTHSSCIAKFGVDDNEVFSDTGFRIRLTFEKPSM